jgi:hypothetical protein
MIARLRFPTFICVLLPSVLRAQGATTAPIDQALGRSGQKTEDVYRIGFPQKRSPRFREMSGDQVGTGAGVVGDFSWNRRQCHGHGRLGGI